MKYQLIMTDYLKPYTIRLFLVNETEYRIIKVNGFRPYFYVLEDMKVNEHDAGVVEIVPGFAGQFGERLKKIFVTEPGVVAKLRDNYKPHFEADIKFPRRFQIDMQIFGAVDVPNDGREEYWYTEIKPATYEHLHLDANHIDIEVYSKKRFPVARLAEYPVVCVSFYLDVQKLYVTFKLHETNGMEQRNKNWTIIYCESEFRLLQNVDEMLQRLHPIIATGWNFSFDVDYLVNRAKQFSINLHFDGINKFDLLEGYKRVSQRSLGNKLKDVVINEELAKEKEMVAEEYHYTFWEDPNQHETLMAYNRDDVRYTFEIDEKYNILWTYYGMKQTVGLEEMASTIHNSVLIDTMLLRQCEKILPSQEELDTERVEGAIVFDTIPGFHKDVITLDFSRFYPSMLIAFNVSKELMHLPLEERVKLPLGEVPKLCLFFGKNRDKFEVIMEDKLVKFGENSSEFKVAKLGRDNMKFLLNAVYGYNLYSRSRFYDPIGMSFMLKMGREFLDYIKVKAQEKGYIIVAGDTDSIQIICKREKIPEAEAYVQQIVNERCKELGIDPIEIKFERYADKALYPKAKGKKRGAKKRYVQHVTLEGDKEVDYFYIKGMDMIRGDQAKITKSLLRDMIKAIFTDTVEEELEKIRILINEMKQGMFTFDEIAVQMNLGANVEDYKKSIPQHIKGVKYAIKNLNLDIRKGDRIKMIFPKKIPGYAYTEALCYTDIAELPEGIEIDYDKTIQRVILGKIEPLLETIGYADDYLTPRQNVGELYS